MQDVIKTISINEALEIAKQHGKEITVATLVRWVNEHVPKLGHQPAGNNGRWYIFEDAFVAFISGKESLCNELLDKIANGE